MSSVTVLLLLFTDVSIMINDVNDGLYKRFYNQWVLELCNQEYKGNLALLQRSISMFNLGVAK